MVKKLSLKEFYENHGNSKPISSCLPTKPGDVPRDADQGYDHRHHRLADLSLDSRSSSGKPYYQDETGYGGGPRHAAPPRSNGHYYSNNGGDVHLGPGAGDVDYYGSGAGYYPKRPFAGGPPTPSLYPRGPGPAAPPLVGGPGPTRPAAYPAAGPAGSGTASVATGGEHYAPGPYGPPPPAAGPGRGGSCGGSVPFSGPPGRPADEDVWYPPPPPPPPRKCPSPTGPQNSDSPAANGSATGAPTMYSSAAPADRSAAMPPAAAQQGSGAEWAAAQAATAGSASDRVAKGVVSAAAAAEPAAIGAVVARQSATELQEKVGKAEAPAHASDKPAATPFAAASAAPASAGPKNEFAERLAARAMSSATRAKSSLLAGSGSSGSSGLTSALSGDKHDAVGGDEGSEQGSGAFVKPSHPFGKPRLVLKPRSAPLPESRATTPSHHGGNTSSASSDSGTDVGEQGSSASVTSSVGRPRLQLQPRSLPVPDDAPAISNAAGDSGRPRLNLLPRGSSNAAAEMESAARKASVFGAAKPKDLPDPVLLDGAGPGRIGSGVQSRLSEAVVARLGSGPDGNGARWGGGSSVSGGDREDDWQTAGRKGSKATKTADAGLAFDDDPFFGSHSRSSYVPVPAPRAFDREIMRDGRGYGKHGGSSYGDDGYSGSYGSKKYGSPAGHGWTGRGGYGGADDDAELDGGVFRRALPTRQTPLAL